MSYRAKLSNYFGNRDRGWILVLLAAAFAGVAIANRLWVMAAPYRLWDDAAKLLPYEKVAGCRPDIF